MKLILPNFVADITQAQLACHVGPTHINSHKEIDPEGLTQLGVVVERPKAQKMNKINAIVWLQIGN